MPVFEAVLKSVKAYWMTFLIYSLVFVSFAPMQAESLAERNEKVFQEEKLAVTVIDQDDSLLSRSLADELGKTQQVTRIRGYVSESEIRRLKDDVNFGIRDYVLILPDGLGQAAEEGHTDIRPRFMQGGTSAAGQLMTTRIDQYLNHLAVYLQSGYKMEDALKDTAEDLTLADESRVVLERQEVRLTRASILFCFNGYSLSMMLCIFVGCLALKFRQKDLASRIRVSGLSFWKRNGGFFGAITAIGILTAFLVIAVVLLDAILHGQHDVPGLPLYILNTLALMCVGLGLGYLISSIAQNDGAVNLLANMVVLSMCFICGVFVDIRFLSPAVVKAAHFMPLYWYNTGVETIAEHSADGRVGASFIMQLVIQLAFSAVFFAGGLMISKMRERYNG